MEKKHYSLYINVNTLLSTKYNSTYNMNYVQLQKSTPFQFSFLDFNYY